MLQLLTAMTVSRHSTKELRIACRCQAHTWVEVGSHAWFGSGWSTLPSFSTVSGTDVICGPDSDTIGL